jgi:hypothetical protein
LEKFWVVFNGGIIMNKKLLNRIALSLALLIPASYLNAVCPCKFKNNATQVPVGYKAQQAEVSPTKSVIMAEEIVENSCETGSCPIIWDTEELDAELNTADQELTQEEIKQVKPQYAWIKKAAAAAGITTAAVAGLVYYFSNKANDERVYHWEGSDADSDDEFFSADEAEAGEYAPSGDES